MGWCLARVDAVVITTIQERHKSNSDKSGNDGSEKDKLSLLIKLNKHDLMIYKDQGFCSEKLDKNDGPIDWGKARLE